MITPVGTAQTNITPSVSYFIDNSQQLSFSLAKQQHYQPAGAEILNFGFNPNAVWVRFTLQQPVDQSHDCVLQLTNWYIDEADLYSPQATGGFAVQKSGDLIPLNQHSIKNRYPTFTVRLNNRQPHTFYLRITSTQYNNFTLLLWPRALFFDTKLSGDSADFSLGLMAMRLAFHIALLFFLFGDRKFRAYSFFGISICLIFFFSGGNGTILFPNAPYLANGMFFTALSFIPAALSYYVFVVIDGRRYLPRVEPVLWGFGVVGLANLIANLFMHHAYLSWAFIGFMSSMLLGLMIIIGVALWKGSRPTIWYMIPALLYIPPFCLFYARNAGLHALPFTETGVRYIFFLEFLCVPFILTALHRTVYHERFSMAKDLYQKQVESESLRQLDQTKTNFFTNISHEFRTPLTLILGPLNDFRQRFPSEDMYQVMHRNASRLQTLINQLLDLSKLDNGQLKAQLQPGNLAADFRIWVASFESLASARQVTLSLIQNQADFPARYDADKLEKITNNLVSNALKFTDAGGQVLVNVAYEGEQLTLTVADTGTGIAPEHLPHIFDRFYQVDASQRRGYEGTGVGLALVRELVLLLNGQITADSTPGEGTTFTMTLPVQPVSPATLPVTSVISAVIAPIIHRAATDPVELRDTDAEPNETGQPVVLIVEDNDDLRAYVRSILSPYYQIREATDGQQGIDLAQHTIPDLVVTDLMMPRLDGMELCRQLRADDRTSHIPVVMLTARATLDDRLQGLETGADDYLTKPFVALELLVRVHNLLTRQQAIRAYLLQQLTKPASPTDTTPQRPPNALTEQQQVFVANLYAQIEQQLDNGEFDVEMLATSLAMTSRTLNRKLTALLNISPNEVIRRYRLRRAAELLQSGLTPTETAYRVGFDNPSYFSRVFRELYGKSPSEYASEHRLSKNQPDLSEN